MSSALPPCVTELTALADSVASRDAARAERALAEATTLALADVPPRTAQTWTVSAPSVVRLIVLHAARRACADLSRSGAVYLTARERELIHRAHTPTRPLTATAAA